MKKILTLALLFVVCCWLSSCTSNEQLPPNITVEGGYVVVNGVKTEYKVDKEDVITVEDGYLVVNGVKTEHKVDKKDVITVEDGYLVVNGVKTEHKVDKEDVITVEEGYLVVNGVKTEYQVDKEDVITVENGYLVVNGVKTDFLVDECNHHWQSVTVLPTCTTEGYEAIKCSNCGKNKTINPLPASHTYAETYLSDDAKHWLACTECGVTKEENEHTLNDEGICAVCNRLVASTSGIVYDFSDDKTHAIVVAYTGTSQKIRIAEEYKGLPVKEIYMNAFYDCDVITSVFIPDSVTYISYNAFYGCDNLVSVRFGNGLETIDNCAFAYCSSLDSILLPNSVTSIGIETFGYCSSLVTVVLGENIKNINLSSFNESNNIKYTEYENCIYLGTQNNPYYVLMGATIKELSTYSINENTVVIGDSAFSGCVRLSDISIPDSVLHIGSSAFASCSKMTTFVVGRNVKTIGANAFYQCTNLVSMVIPKSVTNIGDAALANCTKFSTIYYAGSQEEWKQITIGYAGSGAFTNATKHYNYVMN